jgi:Ca2+-binding EF-hand superfamily protein
MIISFAELAAKYGYALDEDYLSYEELRTLFKTLDGDNDGYISNAEFIKGLKKNAWMAEKLGNHISLVVENFEYSPHIALE